MASGEYARSGVDTEQADRALAALLRELARTQKYGAASELDVGHYAAVVRVGPVQLALTTDGVGTKLLIAEMAGRYDTVGIDCVAMNVNDLICVGATPAAMLDYIAVERADADVFAQLGRGLAEGAKQAGVSIVGGETAQVPDMLRGVTEGKGLDLVGMAIGVIPDGQLIDGTALSPGDVLLGVASSGIHSNGLSLARRTLLPRLELEGHVAELGCALGDELLRPTAIYVPQVKALRAAGIRPHAIAHITGDGLLNLTRLPAPVGFELTELPEPPAIFRLIEELGEIERAEMRTVFNMGVGLCIAVDASDAAKGLDALRSTGLEAWQIGVAVQDPERRVRIRDEQLVGSEKRFAPER